MASLFLVLISVTILVILARAVLKPELIFEYPYFIAAVFGVFIMPQAFSLARFPGGVSDEAVANVLLMSWLCLMAAVMGYVLKPSLALSHRLWRPINLNKLFHVGFFYTLVSFLFAYLMVGTEVQFNDRGGMTGIGTVYLFFIGLAYPGFAICSLVCFYRFTFIRLLLTLLAGVIPLVNVITVRREPTAALVLCVALGLYYSRRLVPPRVMVFGGLLFAALAIPAAGAFRNMLKEGRFSKEIGRFDMVQNFKDYFGRESILELRNAAAVIESTRRFDTYIYGAGYWNQVVFRYVPAQVFGSDLKNSLMFGASLESMSENVDALGYEYSVGSTITGMGDSFQNLSWFGCLFFLLLAVFFRTVWIASLVRNAYFAQLLYMLICTSAMRAVTHQTTDFLPGFIYQFIFLSMASWYAADRNMVVFKRTHL